MEKTGAILAIFLIASLFLSISVVHAQPEHSESYCQVSNLNLNAQGDYLEIEPGGTIEISLDYEIWNRIGCPGCFRQIIVGLNREPLFCAYDGIPGTYPGKKGQRQYSMTAPTEPGTYVVRWMCTSMYTCKDAKDKYRESDYQGYVVGTIKVTKSGNEYCQVSHIDLNGQGNYLEVKPGETIRMDATYKISDSNECPGCKQQIVIGLDNGVPLYCAYNGIPGVNNGIEDGVCEITAPTEPGTYNVMWMCTLEYTCHNAKNIYREQPSARKKIGTIKVTKSDGFGIRAKVSNVKLNKQSNYLEVGTEEYFKISLDYQIWCGAEGNTRRQIIVGWDDEPLWCVYDGIPPEKPGSSSHKSIMEKIQKAGTYNLMWMITFCDNVNDAMDRYRSQPDLREKIGTIKVTDSGSGIHEHYCEVTGISLNGQDGYLEIEPGKTIKLTVYYELWNSDTCPLCGQQIVIGLDDNPMYCAYDGVPGIYPGILDHDHVFYEMTAPTKPSIYNIMWTNALEYTCHNAKNAYRTNPSARKKIGTIKVTGYEEWNSIHYKVVKFPDKYNVPETNISFWQKGNLLRVQIDDYDHWKIKSGYVSISVNESVDIDYDSANVSTKLLSIRDKEIYKEIDSKIGKIEKTFLFALGFVPIVGAGYGIAKYAQEMTDPVDYNWHVSEDLVPGCNLYSEDYFDTNDMLNSQDVVRIPWYTLSATSIRVNCPHLDFPDSGTHNVIFCVDYCVCPPGVVDMLGHLKVRYDVALQITVA